MSNQIDRLREQVYELEHCIQTLKERLENERDECEGRIEDAWESGFLEGQSETFEDSYDQGYQDGLEEAANAE